jgi:hypothetical protein
MNLAGKRCGGFDRNKVVWIVESPLPHFVLCVQPVGTNDG